MWTGESVGGGSRGRLSGQVSEWLVWKGLRVDNLRITQHRQRDIQETGRINDGRMCESVCVVCVCLCAFVCV